MSSSYPGLRLVHLGKNKFFSIFMILEAGSLKNHSALRREGGNVDKGVIVRHIDYLIAV